MPTHARDLLAKMAVTVDHLSAGRLEFGIGAAWAELEHRMLGLGGLDHRVGRLSESLRIITSLWTQERTTFDGRYYRLTDAIGSPKPLQQLHPPIWIGAGGDQMIRLVARHADVWSVSGAARTNPVEHSEKLAAACTAIGRDPAAIRRSITHVMRNGDVAPLLEEAGRAIQNGFTEHIVLLPDREGARGADAVAQRIDDLRALSAGRRPDGP